MSRYKTGDKYVCVSESGIGYNYTKGRVYTSIANSDGLRILDDNGKTILPVEENFKKCEELIPVQSIEELVAENESLATQIGKLEERLMKKLGFYKRNAEEIIRRTESATRVLSIGASQ